MEILVFLIFVSIAIVTLALLFFAWGVNKGTHHHSDRLTRLPLEDDRPEQISQGGQHGE